MRLLWSIVLVAGCAAGDTPTGGGSALPDNRLPVVDDDAVYYRASYRWHLDGLWLPTGADFGIAGIVGQTCQMEYLTGTITSDVDLGDGTETVFDGVLDDDLGATVLVGGRSTIAALGFPEATLDARWDLAGDPIAAGFSELGPVVLVEESSCAVEWPDAWGVSHPISAGACAGEMEVDPDGTAFLAGDRILRARTDDVVEIGGHADLLAWNSDEQRLYAATADGAVRALDRGGALVWEADVGAAIHGLDDLGDGEIVLSVAAPDGWSEIVVLGDGGAELVRQLVRDVAAPVVATPRRAARAGGPDDIAVALVDDGHVHFFGLDPAALRQ